MTLAAQAVIAVPPVPMVTITCHVATWYWAAQEAQALGLTAVKAPLVTLGNIGAMAPSAQDAMLALLPRGNWNFAVIPGTPADGTVLLWPLGVTHSAVVTAMHSITGYNQPAQFPGAGTGYTTRTVIQLAANQRVCRTIAEATIVAAAGALGL